MARRPNHEAGHVRSAGEGMMSDMVHRACLRPYWYFFRYKLGEREQPEQHVTPACNTWQRCAIYAVWAGEVGCSSKKEITPARTAFALISRVLTAVEAVAHSKHFSWPGGLAA